MLFGHIRWFSSVSNVTALTSLPNIKGRTISSSVSSSVAPTLPSPDTPPSPPPAPSPSPCPRPPPSPPPSTPSSSARPPPAVVELRTASPRGGRPLTPTRPLPRPPTSLSLPPSPAPAAAALLTSPTPFGTASAAAPLQGRRAVLHVALARRGGVSSRTQRRLEERGGKKRRGGVDAPAPPDADEDSAAAWEGVEWEGEPLGFEVSTTPMPDLPDPETPDFWEGPQWDGLGFFMQYMWAFGVFFSLIACGVAVATYNDGATDFRETPAFKESTQTQEFPEESESSSSDVFEGNPTEVAPALE